MLIGHQGGQSLHLLCQTQRLSFRVRRPCGTNGWTDGPALWPNSIFAHCKIKQRIHLSYTSWTNYILYMYTVILLHFTVLNTYKGVPYFMQTHLALINVGHFRFSDKFGGVQCSSAVPCVACRTLKINLLSGVHAVFLRCRKCRFFNRLSVFLFQPSAPSQTA